jgi:hypothetical protein
MNANVSDIRSANELKSRPSRIFNAIKVLRGLQKTVVECKVPGDYSKFVVTNEQAYVPDFEFEWCDRKNHYRVYIHTASTTEGKTRRGYSIATINGPLAANDFVQTYRFLHRHRANNKESPTE